MKKTLLAIAITGLFGATAQAATVYDADGTTIDVGADIEINYSKAAADGSEAVMSVDDADISVKLTQVAQDGLSVYGKVELDADDANTTSDEESAVLDHASVGLISAEMGTISFGKQVTIKDDSGIYNDYKLGVSDSVPGVTASGDQVIKYKFANDTFYAGAAYAMNTGVTEGNDSELNSIDGNIGFTGVENLEVVLYAGSNDITAAEALTYMQVQAVFTMDDLTLKALGATTSYDGESGTTFGGQVAYAMDKSTYSVGVQSTDTADVGGADQMDYFAGVGYALSSNATAYAQIGGNDADDSELAYAVGIDVGF